MGDKATSRPEGAKEGSNYQTWRCSWGLLATAGAVCRGSVNSAWRKETRAFHFSLALWSLPVPPTGQTQPEARGHGHVGQLPLAQGRMEKDGHRYGGANRKYPAPLSNYVLCQLFPFRLFYWRGEDCMPMMGWLNLLFYQHYQLFPC